MFRYYGRLALRTPVVLWKSLDWLGRLGMALVVAAPPVAKFAAPDVTTMIPEVIATWWPVAAVAILFTYGLSRANYEQMEQRDAAVVTLTQVNKELRHQLDDRATRRAALDRLGEFRKVANTLLWSQVRSDAELEAFVAREQQWLRETEACIRLNFSSAEAASFLHATGFSSSYSGSYDERHEQVRNRLGFRIEALDALIARHAARV